MKNNAPAATKAQKERFLQVLALGCTICGHDNHGSKLEIHHLLQEGRRMGHEYSICLCEYHHQRHGPKFHLKPVSLVDGSKPFTQAYGSQRSLWEATQRRLGLPIDWPASKIVPRRVPHVDDLRSPGRGSHSEGVLACGKRGALLPGDARVGGPQPRLVGPLEAAAEVSVGMPATGRGAS